MKTSSLFLFILGIIFVNGCSADMIEQNFFSISPDRLGIRLHLHNVPADLYPKPFTIDFSPIIHFVSKGKVNLNIYNSYTSGNFNKTESGTLKGISNFLDPASRFKDSWFGVYLIFDNPEARKYMLKNPSAEPSDPDNIHIANAIELLMFDQKIVVWTTHQNQGGYSWSQFDSEFFFRQNAPGRISRVQDSLGRQWLRISGEYETISACTDIKRCDMKYFSSIRNYVGLPDERVYSRVPPWHTIILKGKINLRYFPCMPRPFWAMVYYNGSRFTDNRGVTVDNWEQKDTEKVLDTMFDTLEIKCIKP